MSARKKAKDAVNLALDEGTTIQEQIAAAFTVCKLIEKYDLLDSPLDTLIGSDNEIIGSIANIVQKTIGDPSLTRDIKKIISEVARGVATRRSRGRSYGGR
jgi:hypothetical protein